MALYDAMEDSTSGDFSDSFEGFYASPRDRGLRLSFDQVPFPPSFPTILPTSTNM